MRVLKFVPALFIFFLLAGPVVLLPRPAYSWCCGCGMCLMAGAWGCSCPGHDGCGWCGVDDDSATLQSNAAGDEVGTQSSIVGRLHSTVGKLDVNERLNELMRGGKPVLANFSFKPLETVDGRKFTCPSSDYETTGNTLQQYVRVYLATDTK